VIKVQGVEKTFPGQSANAAALRGVDIEVGDNEFFVLLGPSGSGKTTLLRCVAGLVTPDAGEIRIGSQVVFSSAARRNVAPEYRGIGMVFQSYAIWPHLTVFQNVALPLTDGPRRHTKAEVTERVNAALRAVQLTGFGSRPAPFLSGGQQQRVALARALAVDPTALLMDEPLSNLDARLREQVRMEIRTVAKQAGVSALYVTHDQTEAMALADRTAVMGAGKVLQVATPKELYDRPATPAIADFLGTMNWLKCRVEERGQAMTDIGLIHLSESSSHKGKPLIGIRPDRVQLSLLPVQGPNTFKGCVDQVSFLGDYELARVQVGGCTILCRTNNLIGSELMGREVFVTFPPERMLVFPEAVAELDSDKLTDTIFYPRSSASIP
jgi:iron(III) transport system ATP-binding protein